ncbi:hypothetical protein SAMN04515667_0039 [Formosa sp. Hel1_31_208]|nr:hypothetical protein SAMN04515667_0039 [Formosa sp. Hel1_31_208]
MLGFTSCQFAENIYINEDGTGKMEFSMDASEMMKMVAEMGEGNEASGMDKAMDSTVVFKDFLYEKRDSIATLPKEEQEKLKALEKFSMHMIVDPESQKMVFDLTSEFNNASELQDVFGALNSFSDMQGAGGTSNNPSSSSPFSSLGSDGSTDVSYSFDGSVFKRTAKIIDKEKHQQAMDSLGQAAMMFGSSRYKINYHFPKPVKSISKEGAMYSEDRKTVTLDVGFMDVLRDPELLDFEIVLEDK